MTKGKLTASLKRIIIMAVISFAIIIQGVFAQGRPGYGQALAVYRAPEGFTITSYAQQWNTPIKLRQISQELLSNTYAQEISALDHIYLYPDSPDGVLAYTYCDLRRDHLGNYQYGDQAYIEIFESNNYQNIHEMAWVLSHEYGHHFTSYHLIHKENKFFDQWPSTGYAKARGITKDPQITYSLESIGDQYKWDVMEMAAEDYVQLLGSPNARRSIIYKDIQQQISEGSSGQFNYEPGFNMKPQNNPELPLAADVRGLEQYFRDLGGLPKGLSHATPAKPKLRLVTQKEVVKGYYQYRLEWDEVPGGQAYEYTLVAYPDNEHAFTYPIKTVSQGEEAYAIVGNGLKVNLKTGIKQLVIDDYRGSYTFNLYIKDTHNKLYKGDSLKINFDHPLIHHKGHYKDAHPQDWSYDVTWQLYGRKIMVGSPDGYFYPLQGVTYLDFATVLQRASGGEIGWGNIPQERLNLLKEKKYLTRDDMALLLYHYLAPKNLPLAEINKNKNFKDEDNISNKKEVQYFHKAGIVGGSGGYYYPQNNITREELASVMIRLLKY